MFHRRTLFASLPALGLATPALAQAPAWPNGPIRIIAPFPPGGSVDTITRLLQPRLAAELGVPVVVENRPGASGALGSQAATRAVGDGNTWVTVFDTHAVNPFLIPNLGFDTERDFAPIMLIGTAPMIITTHNSRPWQNLREVIAAAKEKPDTLTYGSIGNGSLSHLTMTLMQKAGDFRVVHVPYRGGGQLITDLISGKVDFSVATAATVLPQIEAGKLRALAVPLPQRSKLLPDTPTIAEAGPLPGYEVANWYALMGPRNLARPIVTRVNEALVETLRDPEIVAHLARHGLESAPSTPEELAGFMRTETAKWTPIVRASGASIN